jgi:hypothetical protein
MKRVVQPEILDSLPETHPDAIANRRDLRIINAVMGNYRWFKRELPPLLHTGDRVLEIGAGTGTLGLALRRSLVARSVPFDGLDRWSRPGKWPADWNWHQEDLLTFGGYDNYTVLVANLILHQFDEENLHNLGSRIRQSGIRLILASEPARRRIHQRQLRLMRPLGLNPVSRHDGHVSIAAGFQNEELPKLLGLDPDRWNVDCRDRVFGSNRMIALRKEET